MEIMRSRIFMTLTKNSKKLVKRGFKHWRECMLDLADLELEACYFRLFQKHPGWSRNRVAYNVLKSYYSTTTLNNLLIDYEMQSS